MNKKLKEFTTKFLILGLSLALLSCQRSAGDNSFKSDYFYYEGLRQLSANNIPEARKFFQMCFDSGSYYCARKSGEELTKLGGVQERESYCSQLIKRFGDEEALLVAAKEYSDNREYAKVIKITENVNYAESLNSLIYLRFCAMVEKQSSRFEDDVESWFTSRLISSEHYRFYSKYLKNSLENYDFSPEFLNLLEFRISVYRDNYKGAYKKIPELAEEYTKIENVISHLGKACLYGSSEYGKNARWFEKLASAQENFHSKYYCYFYAGRLYEKAGGMNSAAISRFQQAMEYAVDGKEYDNALWYLLDASLKSSTDRAVSNVKKYCTTWSDPEYFEDFFELLGPLLIAERKWGVFADLYKNLDGYASDAVIAGFAYLYGRSLQLGFTRPSSSVDVQKETEDAFFRALKSGTEPYYKIMALYQLGSDEKTVNEVLVHRNDPEELEIDKDAERLLLGYAEYGFPEKIYPEFLELYASGKNIGLDCGIKLAEFLHEIGENRNEYYPFSLRLASRVYSKSEKIPSKKQMEMLFPQDYMDLIDSACEKYNLSPEYILALIRSESFFDSDILSSAGAVGLTQLMTPTAKDVARKLKLQDFDLTDSAQNVEMGVFYLQELITRLDGVVLPAFFSYNAGISKVRRWMDNSRIELGGKVKLPMDIFLETIPYSETRGYGRKLVSASTYYGWLYYNKSLFEIVESIMGKL